MKAKLNFRSVVMKRSWIIVRQTGCSFSSGLTQAWARYRTWKAQKVDELTSKINGFDFCYQYSDDRRTYSYWSKLQDEITTQLQNLPGSFVSAIAQHFQPKQISIFI